MFKVHNTFIEINKGQFVKNLQLIGKYINFEHSINAKPLTTKTNVLLCLPVKANAYGHGLVAMARLAEPYVDYLAVSCLDEGVALRSSGIVKPILVFGAFTAEQVIALVKYNLDITISSMYKAHLVAETCSKLQLKCRVHIKVDTGINRVGVRPETAVGLIDYIMQHNYLSLVGMYSHFAASDELDSELTRAQIIKFNQVVKYVKALDSKVICHIANSAAVCYYPEAYFDMVRPGILSYGYKPVDNLDRLPQMFLDIAPCFSLKSTVVYFKVVAKGQGISYNHTYITQEQTRVVTIPIGYGDGYRVALSNCGEVIIRGRKYRVAGRVCMDMLMVDIGSKGEAYIDDEVVLIGRQGTEEVTAVNMGNKTGMIVYEVLCGFNERIPRFYIA